MICELQTMPQSVVIIVPHPDDLEVLNAHTTLYFVNKGFQVYEILMTGGKYGFQNRFSKERNRINGFILQKIRAKENAAAKKQPMELSRMENRM